MNEQRLINEPNRWTRAGRGKTLQFFAVDQEVQRWLLENLPSEYAPYDLITFDRIQDGQGYMDHAFSCGIEALSQCLNPPPQPRYNVWIRSQTLTPQIPVWRGFMLEQFFSYNGLVLLQHGLMVRDSRTSPERMCREVSRIGIVDRIQHQVSGEIREHKEYLRIYKSLHKAIAKELVYSSIIWDVDGHEMEDTRTDLWTEGAVQSYRSGSAFIHRPGNVIKNKSTAKKK